MSTGPQTTRLEKDSMGTKEIPADVYYGIQTLRAVENYPISGMKAHPTLIRAFGMVKRAAAEANKELGLVDDKRADAAVPTRQGQEVAAYGVAMRKAISGVRRASESLRELGLVGSAVGTGINTPPAYREKAIANLARISGQKLTPASDMRWAMQSNAPMAEVSAALRNLALDVIRISTD